MEKWKFFLPVLMTFFSIAGVSCTRLSSVWTCLSPERRTALGWVPSLRPNINATQKSHWIPSPSPNFSSLKCSLTSGQDCPIFEGNENEWELKKHSDLLYDHRWNEIPTMYIHSNNIETIPIVIQADKALSVPLSILAINNLEIMFGNSNDSATAKGFKLILDSVTHATQLSVSTGIDDNSSEIIQHESVKFQMNNILEGLSKWVHVKIEINTERTVLKLHVANKGHTLVFQLGSANINVNHVFIRSTKKPAYVKFMSYQILKPLRNNSELRATFSSGNLNKLCLSILYMLPTFVTENGELRLTAIHGTQQNVISTDELQAGDSWQELRKEFSLKERTNYSISIKPPASNFAKFKIGEVRVCNDNDMLVSTIETSYEATDPAENIKCYGFNKAKSSKTTNDDTQISIAELGDECEEDKFGRECEFKCSDLPGSSDCKRIAMYNSQGFSCLSYYGGEQCNASVARLKRPLQYHDASHDTISATIRYENGQPQIIFGQGNIANIILEHRLVDVISGDKGNNTWTRGEKAVLDWEKYKNKLLTFSGLKANSRYQLRALLEEEGLPLKCHFLIPVLEGWTTCEVAKKEDITITRGSTSIDFTFKEDARPANGSDKCSYDSYTLSIDYNHFLFNNYTLKVTGLEKSTTYKVDVYTTDLQFSYNVTTKP